MNGEGEKNAVFVKVGDNIEEARNLMLEAQGLMQGEAEKLSRERMEFEEIRKKLDHVHFSKTVKLNVGGKVFKTSLETLRSDPNSMLAAMFSGRFELKLDEDGAYFIDRDGKLFRYILDYLRKGQLDLSEEKLSSLAKPLSTEASFFLLNGLQQLLIPKSVHSFCVSDIITTSQQKREILSFINDSNDGGAEWCLLYKASLHGWKAKQFHQRCDGRYPTLVLVNAEFNILGGYTTEPWWSGDLLEYKCDPNSFLFFLGNSLRKPSMKFNPSPDGGIRYSSIRGPTFGTLEGMDFTMLCHDFPVIAFKGGVGFISSTSQSITKFVARDTLNIQEIEVFSPK